MPKASCVGDLSSHGGVIITSGTDGKGMLRGLDMVAAGALHACPVEGHGITPIVPITSKTYYNGKLLVTAGAIAGCGAIILPAVGDRALVEG